MNLLLPKWYRGELGRETFARPGRKRLLLLYACNWLLRLRRRIRLARRPGPDPRQGPCPGCGQPTRSTRCIRCRMAAEWATNRPLMLARLAGGNPASVLTNRGRPHRPKGGWAAARKAGGTDPQAT